MRMKDEAKLSGIILIVLEKERILKKVSFHKETTYLPVLNGVIIRMIFVRPSQMRSHEILNSNATASVVVLS
jgi:hypothetical protein